MYTEEQSILTTDNEFLQITQGELSRDMIRTDDGCIMNRAVVVPYKSTTLIF